MQVKPPASRPGKRTQNVVLTADEFRRNNQPNAMRTLGPRAPDSGYYENFVKPSRRTAEATTAKFAGANGMILCVRFSDAHMIMPSILRR